jgi:crossover junction endodeoxyribonuclease RuvC
MPAGPHAIITASHSRAKHVTLNFMSALIRILGIDPGLRHCGWGVIDSEGARLSYVAHGVIHPPTTGDMAPRLAALYGALQAIAVQHQPQLAAVEETFVNANPRSALILGQARGVTLAALAVAGLPVRELAARSIKLSVVGTGGADKTQVAFMVQRLLPRAGPVSADAADALACAIACAQEESHTRRLASAAKPARSHGETV